MAWHIPLLLVIGVVIFPITVLVYLLISRIGFLKFFRFIKKADNLAVNYSKDMTDMYKTMVFIPNIVGALANILTKFYTNLNIPEPTILELLFYHLALLVISSVGIGLLRIAETRVLLAFLGEIVSNWAFISGTVLFVNLLFILMGSIGSTLVISMSVVILLFLVVAIYFVLVKSAGTYLEGAKKWKPNTS